MYVRGTFQPVKHYADVNLKNNRALWFPLTLQALWFPLLEAMMAPQKLSGSAAPHLHPEGRFIESTYTIANYYLLKIIITVFLNEIIV